MSCLQMSDNMSEVMDALEKRNGLFGEEEEGSASRKVSLPVQYCIYSYYTYISCTV